jgi:hypothetical protein
MDDLRALFGACCTDPGEVEARCMLFFSRLIGNRTIAADHGARSRADVTELALRPLETQPPRFVSLSCDCRGVPALAGAGGVSRMRQHVSGSLNRRHNCTGPSG